MYLCFGTVKRRAVIEMGMNVNRSVRKFCEIQEIFGITVHMITSLYVSSSLKGAEESYFIGVFKVAAYGHTVSEAGNLYSERLYEL